MEKAELEKQLFQGRRLHLSLRREDTQNRARMPEERDLLRSRRPGSPGSQRLRQRDQRRRRRRSHRRRAHKKGRKPILRRPEKRAPDSPRLPDHAKAFRVGENSENLQNLLWEFTNL